MEPDFFIRAKLENVIIHEWTEEEVERQHQGMDKPGVRQVPEGRGKMEKTGCKIICGAPTTLAVKELMMMMMMMMSGVNRNVY